MKRKTKQAITQDEVSAALAQFLRHGGIIKKLPDQTYQATGRVGADKYEAFETLTDLKAMTGSNEQVA